MLYGDLVTFYKLPFKNKIVLASKQYPEIGCAACIKDYNRIILNDEMLSPSNR